MADLLDITPTEIDLVITRGADQSLAFRLTDRGGRASSGAHPSVGDDDGEVVDITLDNVKFTAKDKLGGTVKIATKTKVPPHTDNTNGLTTVEIDKTEIDDEASATESVDWVYEVRRVIGGGTGDEVVHIAGKLTVEPVAGTG